MTAATMLSMRFVLMFERAFLFYRLQYAQLQILTAETACGGTAWIFFIIIRPV